MKSVIGDVVRNTRLQDASYISDAHDWVYEAMQLMEVEQSLVGDWKELTIDFHKASLPCELAYVDAVEYCGRRLREGGSARPAEKDRPIRKEESEFLSTVDKTVQEDGTTTYQSRIEAIRSCSFDPVEYYYTEMGAINTSFRRGKVTVYYHRPETDREGLAMIPDNQNFRLACYWYCRAMMIGAGFEDKQFTFDHCWKMFDDVYMPRAIAEMTYPSPEQMEHRVNTFVRLLPSEGYYDSFFQTDRPEAPYRI